MNKFLVLFLLAFSLSIYDIHAECADSLALTPPMGWSSWNCFNSDISEQKIREIADFMVSTGMKDAGYEYLNIDDCWQIGRDEDGNIIVDDKNFPSGMKALADYVHSKGLKFGIYSCAGTMTCAGRPGSFGYEFQDARTYASWGVDYLKYDWCNNEGRNAQAAYKIMSDALKKSGRPIILSICEWGHSKPWTWGQGIGQLWRTTHDIISVFSGTIHWGALGIVEIIDQNAELYKYSGPGHWNDPDMLQVGNPGLSMEENRSHFTMWCMLAAPLMAGNDIRKMDKEVAKILMNKEVIAVDQDRLGKQGRRYKVFGKNEIWVKQLSGDEIAVCLFNRDDHFSWNLDIDWQKEDFSLVGVNLTEKKYKVRDLWKQKDLGTVADKMSFDVPVHGVVLLRLTPEK